MFVVTSREDVLAKYSSLTFNLFLRVYIGESFVSSDLIQYVFE